MTELYSEDQTLTCVVNLTRPRLMAFVEAEIVIPLHVEGALAFRPIDLARLKLICDLSESFDLGVDALCVVMSLIDQLHAARADLAGVMTAISAEPPEVRTRIAKALRGTGNQA